MCRLRADKREFGLATLCIGVGQFAEMIVKRV
ncbi:MAG: hypothetical protein F2912_04565 [Actinobacteria bacterium]|nr:hypothetical protein [Actinomycetota bacterium]